MSNMPGLDGFGVLAALPAESLPAVIFTTAYDQHALRAFDASAVDYLLKPFKPTRFREALDRVRDRLRSREGNAELLALLQRREPALPHPKHM